MFTKDILYGMNILTLAGSVVMGLSLTLRRMAAAGRRLCIGLMCAGTVLVFLGLYTGGSSNSPQGFEHRVGLCESLSNAFQSLPRLRCPQRLADLPFPYC